MRTPLPGPRWRSSLRRGAFPLDNENQSLRLLKEEALQLLAGYRAKIVAKEATFEVNLLQLKTIDSIMVKATAEMFLRMKKMNISLRSWPVSSVTAAVPRRVETLECLDLARCRSPLRMPPLP